MIELSNVKLSLDDLLPENKDRLLTVAADILGISCAQISQVRVVKKSVDARKKSDVHFVVTLGASLVSEGAELAVFKENAALDEEDRQVILFPGESSQIPVAHVAKNIRLARNEKPFMVPVVPERLLKKGVERPLVVGLGPAGLFAALYLARAGLRPLVVERGASVDERVAAVDAFNQGGDFNPQTNIQFGEGGAGTFSDGKLNTNIKNPLVNTVLQWFAEAGAPADILVEAKPHIGTDELRHVVKTMRQQIQALGGEVRFNTQLEEFRFEQGVLVGAVLKDTRTGAMEEVSVTQAILATGHSARDTFAMVRDAGLLMERKPFSVGVRIEHPQSMIDRSQYGPAAGHPALKPADYKLSTHLKNGRGVYTFCMCPGGQVVAAASEEGGVVVNGMSVHARDGQNANSAVLVSVDPTDFPGDDVLAGVEFQRTWEQTAYKVARMNGGKPYQAPAQQVGKFLGLSKKQLRAAAEKYDFTLPAVQPSYPRGVVWCDLHECLPDFVSESLEQALPQFDRKIKGFAHPNAVMTAIETRSSSPVRLVRGKNYQASFAASNVETAPPTGVYPCGEGAGYAGGIASAAVDGLRVAAALVKEVSLIDLEELGNGMAVAGGSLQHMTTVAPTDSPLERWVASDGTVYEYRLQSDGAALIETCVPASAELRMPSEIQGAPVTALGSKALTNCGQVTLLELPAALRRMRTGALKNLNNLRILHLPAVAVSFDLRDLSVGHHLDELWLPDLLEKIPAHLFDSCTIDTLVVGANTRLVTDTAFAKSTLKHIRVSAVNPWLESDGLGLYEKNSQRFVALAALSESYAVRSGCVSIGAKSFSALSGLSHVDLPDSVEVVEEFAFFRCGLTEFCAPANLKSLGKKAFNQCTKLASVKLNHGLECMGEECFTRTALTALELPSTLKQVRASFCDESHTIDGQVVPLVSVAAPQPGEEPLFFMEDHAALYCHTPQGVTLLAFLDGDARTCELSPQVTEIAPYAFARKAALELVEVPAGLRVIGENAFRMCSKLKAVAGSEALESVGEGAFMGTKVDWFYLPKTFRSMSQGSFALKDNSSVGFAECIRVLKVHPENPHFFMENGFLCMREGHDITALQYVDDLEQAVIPNCVTILGPYCLVNAHNLTTLELHDGIETYAPGSLRSASLVGTVVFHCRKEPFQGRSELRFSFDQARVGIDGIRQAFESTTLNLPFAFEVSDQTMYWAHDVFRVGAFILGRLRDPLCLTTVSQHHFEEYCTVHLKQFFTLFAQKNYQQGYDDLVALSYLNKENMAVALDEAQKAGNVEIAAHLLEIRRSFGSDVMSAYDI